MCKHIWKLWTRFINKSRCKRQSVRALVCRALHNCTNYSISLTSSILHNTTATTMEQCHESRHSYGVKTPRDSRHHTHLSLRDTNLTTFRRQHAGGRRQISPCCCDTSGRNQSGSCLWSESFVWLPPGCLVLGSRNVALVRGARGRARRRPPATSLFSPPAADTAAWCRL